MHVLNTSTLDYSICVFIDKYTHLSTILGVFVLVLQLFVLCLKTLNLAVSL